MMTSWLATGVTPRELTIEGIDHPKVLSYIEVCLRERKPVGKKVAIIGAGGIWSRYCRILKP